MGHFIGQVRAEWLLGEPRMRLLEDFAFVDSQGKRWTAPAGSLTDGASIPRALWALAGSPFDGAYRRAAVIHDAYCPSDESPRDVHRMFHEAMLADGVEPNLAMNFYLAVRAWGPKWGEPEFVAVERALDLAELAAGR